MQANLTGGPPKRKKQRDICLLLLRRYAAPCLAAGLPGRRGEDGSDHLPQVFIRDRPIGRHGQRPPYPGTATPDLCHQDGFGILIAPVFFGNLLKSGAHQLAVKRVAAGAAIFLLQVFQRM